MRAHVMAGLTVLAFGVGCSTSTTGSETTSSSSSSGMASSSSSGQASSGNAPRDTLLQPALTQLTTDLASDSMNGRDEGTAGGASAREYIKAYLASCGITPAGTDGYEQAITGGDGINLIGRIQGTDNARNMRHILLSAHYDHLGACGGGICNGANDNAAGVAIMLGVACELAKNPRARSVLVAAWDAEEPPTFLSAEMGSQFFAVNPVVPLDTIDAAVVMDLVGGDLWPGYAGHFLLGAELSPEVKAAVTGATVPDGLKAHRLGLHLVEVTRAGNQPWSDYDAFRDRGVPVLFLSNGQNKQYHTPEDDVSGINFPKMAQQAPYLYAIMAAAGDATTTPTFDSGARDDASDADGIIAVLTDALGRGGLTEALSLSNASRTAMQEDLTRVEAVRVKTMANTPLSNTDVTNLRRAVQRMMCLAGSTYDEPTCAFL